MVQQIFSQPVPPAVLVIIVGLHQINLAIFGMALQIVMIILAIILTNLLFGLVPMGVIPILLYTLLQLQQEALFMIIRSFALVVMGWAITVSTLWSIISMELM